jgi:hypothetical protein
MGASANPTADQPSERSPMLSGTNDQQVTLQVLINLSDRDTLEGMPVNSRAKFTVKKVSQKGAQVKVIRLKKVPAEIETSSDW